MKLKKGRPKQIVIDGKKACSRCKKWVRLERYAPNRHTSSGRASDCPYCRAARYRTTYAKRKIQMKQQVDMDTIKNGAGAG